MTRFVSVVLSILAVIGLLVPSVQVVHAHDGGHDPHDHGNARTVHVTLHGHPHPHAAVLSLSTPGRSDAGDDERETLPNDEDAPRHHVHQAQSLDAIGRLRGVHQPIDDLAPTTITASLPVGLWSLQIARLSVGAFTRRGRRAPRACSRSMDRLIVLGRLLI